MKNKELYKYRDGLNQCDFKHPRITFIINKNKRLLDEYISDMEKEIKPSEGFLAFSNKREELVKEFCNKDENGNPKIITLKNGQQIYDLPQKEDPTSEFNLKLKELEKEHKSNIDAQVEKERQYYLEFLEDESSFEPTMLSLSILEENEICPQKIMDGIYWMITE